MSKADDEREFREEVLRSIVRHDVKIDQIIERQVRHEHDDERRFTGMTQSIDGALTLKQIGWTLAGITATMATFWGIIALIERLAKP